MAGRLAPDPKANRFLTAFPPGHYYSPIPDRAAVENNAGRLFNDQARTLPGIDDNKAGQLQLAQQLSQFANDYQPAETEATAKAAAARFYLDNAFYNSIDAYIYHGMLRQHRPKRVIEIGSGFSSALALDVCEKFVKPHPHFTFVEPFPERLNELLRAQDTQHATLCQQPVQELNPEIFLELEAGDFLFIDSSHVSKIGSDVNFLLLDILPRLTPGVIIHIHDVFWPFEYPKAWLDEGRCWNEAYLLRGILASSTRYRVLMFNSQLQKQNPEAFAGFPSWARQGSAQGIWLEVNA